MSLAACGKSSSPIPSAGSSTEAARTPSPTGSKVADCKVAATEVGRFLTTMDHEGNVLSLEHVSPAQRTDLTLHEEALRQAPVVEIRADDIFFHDQRMSRSELDPQLVDAHRRIHEDMVAGRFPRVDPPDPDSMIVLIDEHARWTAAVTGLQSAHRAGFDHVTLVFRRPATTAPPPHTKVDDDIAKLMKDTESDNKATAFAGYARSLVASCPALIHVFGEVSANDVADKAGYMLSRIGPALIECDCAADPAEIRSLMWNLAGNPHPVGVIQVVLDPKAKPLVATADTPWSDASKQLSVDATKAWFVVE